MKTFLALKRNTLLILFTFVFFSLNGATIVWNGSGGTSNWSTAANWSGGVVPAAIDDAVIPSGFNVDINNPVSKINSLVIDGSILNLNHALAQWYITGFSPAYPFNSITLLNNATLINSGVLSPISIHAYTGSLIVNNAQIKFLTDPANIAFNIRLDQSQLVNYDEISLDDTSIFNIPQGSTFYFIVATGNQSQIDNFGSILHTRIAGYDTDIMIGLSSSAQFENHVGSLLIGKGIRLTGIEISNFADQSPKTKFDNSGKVEMEICTSCSTSTNSAVVFVDFASAFTNNPSGVVINLGFVFLYVNDGACFIDNGLPVLVFGPANFVNMGYMVFGSLAVIQGTGILDPSSFTFLGTYFPWLSDQVGTIGFNHPYQQNGPTFKAYLAGTTGPNGEAEHDRFKFHSDENDISGTKLKVILCDWYAPQPGDEFELVSGLYSGTFLSLSLPGNESDWKVTYNDNNITLELLNELTNLKNLGVGTDDPLTKVHLKGGDVYVDQISAGIIFRVSDVKCRKLIVEENGDLSTEVVPCPN